MADKSTSSYGMELYRAADADTLPSSFSTKIGEIIELNNNDFNVKTINATHINQSDRAMRFKAGMYDSGTLKGKLYYDGTDYDAVRDLAVAGTILWFQLQIPTAASVSNKDKFSFRGFFTDFSLDLPAEGAEMTCDFSIKITGPVTNTPYSA